MEIKMYKMVTGEVVMGNLKEKTEESLTLTKPVTLMLDPMQGGVGMIPYDAIYTQEEPQDFTWDTKFIMHEMKVQTQFEDAYLKQVTGIETPSKDIIT